MTNEAWNEILALGAITGVRSMAGPAALARTRQSGLAPFAAVLAVGEMIADKSARIPARTDALPLAGRAIMGAVVGGVIAHEDRGSVLFGGLLGAAVAVAAAHLAYHLRKRAPLPNVLAGLVEDAVVVAVGARYGNRAATTA